MRSPAAPEGDRQLLLSTLQKMGFLPTSPSVRSGGNDADLWVRSSRGRNVVGVFVEAPSTLPNEVRTRELVERWSSGLGITSPAGKGGSSILVVDSDNSAATAGQAMVTASPMPLSVAIARTRILVLPRKGEGESPSAHWHRLRLPPRVVLMLATGTLVGLAQRNRGDDEGEGEGAVPIDIEGMFRALRQTFSVDIEGSFGVKREEDAMFLMYQLALKETYAPGDQGASLHELVHNPKGPAARLPWFAI